MFYPELHPDLASYWPLDESSGYILHDISIYGARQTFSSLTWNNDKDLKGKMVFSKHFLTEDGSLSGQEVQLLTKTASCTSSCLYCATKNYCKSCAYNALLDPGAPESQENCNVEASVISGLQFYKDEEEREYKVIKENARQCKNPNCFVCDLSDSDICSTCILNGKYNSLDKNCFGKCPDNRYDRGDGTCANCDAPGDNCARCRNANECEVCNPGFMLDKSFKCRSPKCGDGVVDGWEECDDGNLVSGDGCSSVCVIEKYFECDNSDSPSKCKPICGDGVFIGLGGEECDNGMIDKYGNIVNPDGNGCSSKCKIEAGWWCVTPHVGARSSCYCSPYPVRTPSAFLDGDYSVLHFEFNKTLHEHSASGGELCQKLFGEATMYFGNGYYCVVEGKKLRVHLGEDNEVYGGEELWTAKGGIKADGCAETFGGSFSLAVSEIPAQTVDAVAEFPERVSPCEPVRVILKNVKGGLDRPFREISLTAVEVKKNGASEEELSRNKELVNAKLSEFIKHDAETYFLDLPEGLLLDEAEYKATLNMVNFQGIKMPQEQTYTFTTTSNLLLTARIEGAKENDTVEVCKHENVTIKTIPKLSACGKSNSTISDVSVVYESVKCNGTEVVKDYAGRILRIPGNTLDVDAVCEVVIALKIKGTDVKVTKRCYIKVIHSPIITSVSPQNLIVGNKQDFTISAEGSYDRIFILRNSRECRRVGI